MSIQNPLTPGPSPRRGEGRRNGAAVDDSGDVDVIHHGQGLAFGFEAGDDLFTVHARLDDLQSDLAMHRLCLFSHEYDAHAAYADLLQQLVGADDSAGAFGCVQADGGRSDSERRLEE